MKSALLKNALTISILVLATWFIFLPVRSEILYPRLGQPVILQAGDNFNIKIKNSIPYWSQQWRASLKSTSGSIPLKITQSKTDFAFQQLTLKLPENIKDNRYSLYLSSDEIHMERSAAVYVVSKPSDNIRIIQMADLPTLSASGNKKGDLQLKKIIQEINLINPQLVLFTGDLAYEGSWAQYYQLLKAMNSVDSPLIAAPGNHEYQGWSAFLTLLGQPYHSTIYGNYLIVSINSGHSRDQLTYSQLKWLKLTLENNKNKTIIVQLHHSIHHRKGDRGYLKNNVKPLLKLLKKYSVNIVLSGHWHGDSVFDEKGNLRLNNKKTSGTIFAVTTAAGAKLRKEYSHSPLHHGYRLIQFNNRKLQHFTYDYDGDGERDASSSIPFNQLSLQYDNPYTATISNQLNESFKEIKITFQVPNNKKFSIINAQLLKQYIDGEKTVVQVTSQIDAHTQKVVKLLLQEPPK